MTTAVIAEDEALLRAQLKEMLAAAWPEVEVVAEAEDGTGALESVAAHKPDVVFLDIRMPGLSGLEVARAIADRAHVVFVTAWDRHALEAFESGAVDYLVKPVTLERLETTVARLKSRLGSVPASFETMFARLAESMKKERAEPLRWITASQGNQTRMVMIQDVVYFQSDSKYTRVVSAEGEVLIRKPIRALAEELDPAMFRQVHRSTIVNLREVKALVRGEDGHAVIQLKSRPETLAVSDSFLPLFRQM
jgi:DNA-binding LytR/AlgR family response regulator